MNHHDHTEAQPAPVAGKDIRATRAFVLSGLSSGHGVFHWYLQSFWVALPKIQTELSLSNLQVGTVITVREFLSGLVNLPGGFLTDMFRRHWALILAGCMGLLGLGYVVMGFVPNYAALLGVMVLAAVPPAIWHLPAMASLSRRFVQRRGLAMAAHSMGGSVADFTGPIVTGLLLVFLTWRQVLSYYGIPALLLAPVVWWAFKPLNTQVAGPRVSATQQWRAVKQLMRKSSVMGLMAVAGIRGAAHTALFTFLAIYLSKELDMSSPGVGFHIGLLTLLGIFSAPVLGGLSDRFGRKAILLPGLVVEGFLVLALLASGAGVLLTVTVGFMGIFIFSDQPVLTAGIMDAIGEGVEATGLGVLSTFRFLLSAASPVIAGQLSDAFGVRATFIYVAALFFLAALVILFLRLPRPGHAARPHQH